MEEHLSLYIIYIYIYIYIYISPYLYVSRKKNLLLEAKKLVGFLENGGFGN